MKMVLKMISITRKMEVNILILFNINSHSNNSHKLPFQSTKTLIVFLVVCLQKTISEMKVNLHFQKIQIILRKQFSLTMGENTVIYLVLTLIRC